MCCKYILIALAVCFTLLFMSCSSNQPSDNNNPKDTIPDYTNKLADPDFENWKQFYSTTGTLLYEDPANGWWASLNKLALIGGPATSSKTTDAHSGKFAIKLETMKYGDFIITGLLLSGVFDPILLKDVPNYVIEGKPFKKKPIKFSGYFKYFPADGDSCNFYINITRYNPVTNQRDTIADANLYAWDTVSTYRLFEMPLTYYRTDLEPDTIKIAIISSAGGRDYTGQGTPKVGSVILLDDLSLEIPTGIIYLMDEKTKSTK